MSRFIPDEFHYRLGWRTRGAQPGAHPTRTSGGGADFRGYVPFLESPDPRRIDLRSSLRTVPRRLMVRAFHERGAVAVYAVIDLSASMRFGGNGEGRQEKRLLAADIAASIAWSATRGGDAFGLVACDDTLRTDLFEAPSSRRGSAAEVRNKLLQAELYPGAGASALPLAVQQLRAKRSLVFFISDFHLDGTLLRKTLDALAIHDVVPIVLWDSAEYADLPAWGWARVRDMESGSERALFLRPHLAQAIRSAYGEWQTELTLLCRKAGTRSPFFVRNRFDAEQLTQHLSGAI